ncbi:MAG: hypothetical protein WBP81_15995 [Solirubrobacteraceae bacterium]
MKIDSLADVLNVEQVRPVLADQRQQPRERTGPVRQARQQNQPTADLGFVPPRRLGQQAGVDIPAREDKPALPVTTPPSQRSPSAASFARTPRSCARLDVWFRGQGCVPERLS